MLVSLNSPLLLLGLPSSLSPVSSLQQENKTGENKIAMDHFFFFSIKQFAFDTSGFIYQRGKKIFDSKLTEAESTHSNYFTFFIF